MRRSIRLVGAIAIVVLVTQSVPGPMERARASSPDANSCRWITLAPIPKGRAHFASAVDPSTDRAHFFGGVSATGEVQSALMFLNMADGDITKARHGRTTISGPLGRSGAAGAFRSVDGGGAYWIGGAGDDGVGSNMVQRFDPATTTWTLSNLTKGGLTPRLHSVAAYDPKHDAIVVHGGTQRCKPGAMPSKDQCRGANLGTSFLIFDSGSTMPTWLPGPSFEGGHAPGQIYGHSMIYDPLAERMIVFGGTSDGRLSIRDVHVLDLSGPDLADANWQKLTVESGPSARFFHTAAFDAAHNRMVVHGGVTRNLHGADEHVARDTWALDFSVTPPRWSSLGSTMPGPGERVGGRMVYSPKHQTVIVHSGRARFERPGPQFGAQESTFLDCTQAPTTTPAPPTPNPTPGNEGESVPIACTSLSRRAPQAVVNSAVANPWTIHGYLEPANPNRPPGPGNQPRRHLQLWNPGSPWHPMFNSLHFTAGCS